MTRYLVVSRKGCGEITEKKSRFIASVFPVKNEAEAAMHIEEVRKKYWDAKHNCHAFVAGENDEVQRCSDDREPSGTAGKPMLEVIQSKGLHDCLIVVTRYFGGVLLGTGGLVRAYTSAALAGLENAGLKERITGKRIELATDYSDLAKLQHIAGQLGLTLDDIEYTDRIKAVVLADNEAADEFIRRSTDITAGRAVYDIREGMYIYRDADSDV